MAPALDYLPMSFTLLFFAVGHIFMPTTYKDTDKTPSLSVNNTIAAVASRLIFAGGLVGLWIFYLLELPSSERKIVLSFALNYIPMLSVLFLSTEEDIGSACFDFQHHSEGRGVSSNSSTWSKMKKMIGNLATSPIVQVSSLLGGVALSLAYYQDISPFFDEGVLAQSLEYFPSTFGSLVFLQGVIDKRTENSSSNKAVATTTVSIKAICTGVMIWVWTWAFLSELAPMIQEIAVSQALKYMWLPLISITFFHGDAEAEHIETGVASLLHEASGPQSSKKNTQGHLSQEPNSSYGDTAVHMLLAIAMVLWVMCWTVMPESKAIAVSSNILLGGYFAHLLT